MYTNLMNNLASQITQNLLQWRLDEAERLLEQEGYILPEEQFGKYLSDLSDYRAVERWVKKLNVSISRQNYDASVTIIESLQEFSQIISSHPEYDNLINQFQELETLFQSQELNNIFQKIDESLRDDNFDLTGAEDAFASIQFFPADIRRNFQGDIEQRRTAIETMRLQNIAIQKIDHAARLNQYRALRQFVMEARALGVSADRLKDYEDKLEQDEKRSRGISITLEEAAKVSKIDADEMLGRAQDSATKIDNYRLAYNISQHRFVYSNLSDDERKKVESESKDFKKKLDADVIKSADFFMNQADEALKRGNYDDTEELIRWAWQSGEVPPKLPGAISDYAGQIELKNLEGAQDLLVRINDLEKSLKHHREKRRQATVVYQKAVSILQRRTTKDIADSVDALSNVISIDPEYPAAQFILDQQRQKYTESMRQHIENEKEALEIALNRPDFSRAEQILKAIRDAEVRDRNKIIGNVFPTGDELKVYDDRIKEGRERAKASDALKQNILAEFNSARHNLSAIQKDSIISLVNEWSKLAYRKIDVERIQHQIKIFFDNECPELSRNVQSILDVLKNEPNDEELSELLDEVNALKAYGSGLRKVEQALVDYWSKRGLLAQGVNDNITAYDYYSRARGHAKLAEDLSKADSLERTITDLEKNIGEASQVLKLKNALREIVTNKDYEVVKNTIEKFPDAQKDPEISLILADAERNLERIKHDNLLDQANQAIHDPSKRDFAAAKKYAQDALKCVPSSAVAQATESLAISRETQELEQINKLNELTALGKYPAAKLIAEISRQLVIYGSRLKLEVDNLESKYSQWVKTNEEKWQTSQQQAQEIIQNKLDLDSDFVQFQEQALMILRSALTENWMPENYSEKTKEIIFDKILLCDQVKIEYQKAVKLEELGNIAASLTIIDACPPSVPLRVKTQLENYSKLLGDKLDAFGLVDNSIQRSMHELNQILVELPNKKDLDYVRLSHVQRELAEGKKNAAQLESLYIEESNSELQKNDSALPNVQEKASLFLSGNVQRRFQVLHDQYKYLYSISEWLLRDLVQGIKSGNIDHFQSRYAAYKNGLPFELSGLGQGLDCLDSWLEERKKVLHVLNETNIGSLSFYWPQLLGNRIWINLEKLESLDGKTVKKDNQHKYVIDNSDKPRNISARPSWELEKINSRRETLKDLLNNRKAATVTGLLRAISLLFISTGIIYLVILGARKAIVTAFPPSPTITPTSTLTPTPTNTLTPTLSPTVTFTPTPSPVSGVILGTINIRRYPSDNAPVLDNSYVLPGEKISILRYCKAPNGMHWLLLDLDSRYGWIALRVNPELESRPLVEINGRVERPEINLPADIEVECPGLYTPVPGLATPNPNW